MKILNAQASEIDEEFQLRREGEEDYLVKIVKYLNVHSKERCQHIEDCLNIFYQEATEKEGSVFKEHLEHMIATGEVPEAVRKVFHLKKGQHFDDLLAEITPPPHLTRKGTLASTQTSSCFGKWPTFRRSR